MEDKFPDRLRRLRRLRREKGVSGKVAGKGRRRLLAGRHYGASGAGG